MKKFYVNHEEVSEEVFGKRLRSEIEEYYSEYYDDAIDEIYDEVVIGPCTFYASDILRELDLEAYNAGKKKEVDIQMDDAFYFMECRKETVEYNSIIFKIIEE